MKMSGGTEKKNRCIRAVNREEQQYQHSGMKKEAVLEKLRKAGYRITRQRELLLDVILEEPCTCCKEIYYIAVKQDPKLGIATIYRTLNMLEEVGALKRRPVYRIGSQGIRRDGNCVVYMDDETSVTLDKEKLRRVIEKGMDSCGYLKKNRKVKQVLVDKISQ